MKEEIKGGNMSTRAEERRRNERKQEVTNKKRGEETKD